MSYTYGQARSAVAAVIGVRSESLPALRGRFQHHQRVNGGAPGKPGRGHVASYSFDDVFRIALELRLSALGLGIKQCVEIFAVKDIAKYADAWAIYRHSPFDPWIVVNPGFDFSFIPARVDDITINTACLKQELAGVLGDIDALKAPIIRY